MPEETTIALQLNHSKTLQVAPKGDVVIWLWKFIWQHSGTMGPEAPLQPWSVNSDDDVASLWASGTIKPSEFIKKVPEGPFSCQNPKSNWIPALWNVSSSTAQKREFCKTGTTARTKPESFPLGLRHNQTIRIHQEGARRSILMSKPKTFHQSTSQWGSSKPGSKLMPPSALGATWAASGDSMRREN